MTRNYSSSLAVGAFHRLRDTGFVKLWERVRSSSALLKFLMATRLVVYFGMGDDRDQLNEARDAQRQGIPVGGAEHTMLSSGLSATVATAVISRG